MAPTRLERTARRAVSGLLARYVLAAIAKKAELVLARVVTFKGVSRFDPGHPEPAVSKPTGSART
jgi:hypothetical protein